MREMYELYKPRLIVFLVLLSLFVMFLQMGFFIAHEIWSIETKWNVFQYCLSLIDENTYGHIAVKILFYLVILYTAARIIWRIFKQLYLSSIWSYTFHKKKNSKLTKKLNYKYRHWNVKFIVITEEAFVALTMGLFRPKVVVSSGVLKSFSASEIQVILQHERYHYIQHDPFKIFLSTLMSDGLGYIPIFKNFLHYYKTCKELMADRFVMKKMGTEYDLGKVLLKVSQMRTISAPLIGVHFADIAMNYRIIQFLQPEKPVSVPFLQAKPFVMSVFLLMIMSIIAMGGCS